jgi:ABC-2 type transport system permease protein
MYINKVHVSLSILWVPFFIFEIFIFALSIGFILSSLYVRLRDLNYIWEVIMQAMFYATPIIYPLSRVSDRWPWAAKLLLLNPVAQAVQAIRYHGITNSTQILSQVAHNRLLSLVPYFIVLLMLLIAIWLFRKRSPHFAEEV